MQSIYIYGSQDAAHGMIVQERHMDIVANNLANVNTAGFKADRQIFNWYMTREVKIDFSQGPLRETERALDVALAGEGFFQVQTPQGVRLTRNGQFTTQANGALVDQNGNPVLGLGNAPITINPQGASPVINDDGQIFQGGELVGRLAVVEAADLSELEKAGGNLFAGREGQTPQTKPAQDVQTFQGYVEAANVQVVTEMVNMIEAHRAFESYAKALQALDQMDKQSASSVGRVG